MDQQAATAEIRQLELSLHRADVRGSRERVDQLLADDFMEFGKSGSVYDKCLLIEVLAQERGGSPQLSVEDFAVRFLSETIALATYRATAPSRRTLRSSIWRHESSGWRMTFHQGTPIPPA